MNQTTSGTLELELIRTGERLSLRRVRTAAGIEELQISGSLPPRQEGPPLHIHRYEDERGEVVSGTLSAMADGRRISVAAGGSAEFRKGSAHRWWNEGDTEVVFRGVATPVRDLDRFLQALFEVLNANPAGRPSLFYLAHVLHRHRGTQIALVMPRWLQPLLLPVVVGVGAVLGKYRGTAWPGCPSRCTGAPRAERATC